MRSMTTGAGRAAEKVEQFLLQENIRLFRQRLSEPHEPRVLETIRKLLAAAERQLALLDAERRGATTIPTVVGTSGKFETRDQLAQLRKIFEADKRPHLIVDPRPGLHIVDERGAHALPFHARSLLCKTLRQNRFWRWIST